MSLAADLRSPCKAFVRAFLVRLQKMRIWPRPAGMPGPRLGQDFVWPDVDNMPQLDAATQAIAQHPSLTALYSDRGRPPEPEQFRDPLLMLAERVASDLVAELPFEAAFSANYRAFVSELRRPYYEIRSLHAIEHLHFRSGAIRLDSSSSLVPFGGFLTANLLGLEHQRPLTTYLLS
jgi:hypothetical protein